MCKKGYLQSPVDIATIRAEKCQRPPLCFMNHFEDNVTFNMFQDNDTVNFTGCSDCPVAVQGGPLNGRFILGEVVLHWGTKNDNGSEHSIDRIKYAMEAQLMYYNEIYGCLSAAMNQPDGVAILGVLLHATKCGDNPCMNQLAACLGGLNCPGATVPLPFNILKTFKSVLDKQEYFSYEGSLTKPPCCEEVRWMVFRDRVEINCCNVDPFRNLCDRNGNRIGCNSRTLQQLNGRTINEIKPCGAHDRDKDKKPENECKKPPKEKRCF